MLRKVSTLLAFALLAISAFGQTFTGYEVDKSVATNLSKTFKDYHIYQLDLQDLTEYSKNTINESFLTLALGEEFKWDLRIESSNLISDKYKLRYTTERGMVEKPNYYTKAFKGENLNTKGGETRLTIDYEFLHGWVEESGHRYYIEPLYYYQKDAPRDRIVVYHAEDALDSTKKTCGTTHEHDLRTEEQKIAQKAAASSAKMVGNCYILEYALAGDFLMFQSYGSVLGVENHNIAVTNDVASDYDDAFSDEIQFVIVEQFIATSAATDPWTNSTNSGTLLNSFTGWGPTGFSQTHDLGGLWTDRDFDGSTIGVAWLNAVCGNNRYHTFQDFTGNANLKRVLASHEIGHNFSFDHDGAGTPCIMAPAVQNTACWSAQTQGEFDAYIPTITGPNGCLGACPPPIPPVAGYTTNLTGSICAGSYLTFFDNSTNSANSWTWSAPGATPSSSNDANPTFQFPNPGNYTVTLTASNGIGSDSYSQSINVSNGGGTDFFFFEDFENGAPTFTIDNPDNGITWTQTNVAGTRQGNQAMWVDNFSYNAAGQRDGLVSPTLDFSGRTNTSLELEYAYRRYNNQFADSLIVLISTNNGTTYTRVFSGGENGSGSFATLDDSTTEFFPGAEADWCFGTTYGPGCIDVDLSAYDGATNVKVKIENYCGYGNSMFVDNLRLFSQCASFVAPVAAFSSNTNQGCAPTTIQYFDDSQNGPTSWNWVFPGGTPASSTQQNPTVTYNNAGTFSTTLTVTNSVGSNTITNPNAVTIEEEPFSGWSSTETDLVVDFTDQSSGTPTSWNWSFGDNTGSNDQNPTHTYAVDGTYVVTLTVTNNCGTNAFTNTVTVASAPVAGFTSDVQEGCAPFLVNFSDNSSENTTGWQWSFEGGNPSTSNNPNPTVQYTVPGTYDVTLIATNSNGQNTVFESSYVTVESVPTPGFTNNVNGQNVDFTNTSINANTYSWDFGDNSTSGAASPNHTYASDGTYTVTLSATNDCGTETTTQVVVISTQPVAAFSAGATSGCVPFTVQFNNNSSENAQAFSWQFPGGSPATSTATNPVITYNTMGTFDVILTVSNASGQNTSTETSYITVGDTPSAGYNNSVNGQVATFTNTSTNATSFNWDFGDNTSSNDINPVHDYGADGTYTVVLEATNSCGTTTTVQSVVVATAPTAGFTANVTQGCTPMTVQFNNESSENVTGYMWTFEGGTPGTSTDASPTVIYNTPGTFDVTLVVSNSVGNNTSSQTDLIVVNTTPTAGFSSTTNNLTADFNNTSSNATSYSWNFGDNATSPDANPTHTYAADGTYTVTLSATNECGTVTSTETVVIATAPTASFSANVTQGCTPLTVQFNNESSENSSTFMWTFEGGTPATSTDPSPTVVYNTAGTFDVTLEVSNSVGNNSSVQTDLIIVNTTPTVGFVSTSNNLVVDFDNTSSNATSYAWNFGDNMTSNEIDPSHTYASDGTYTVTLSATNECGTITSTETVFVSSLPVPNFTADVTEGCAPMTVQFSDASSENAENWMWTFEGGTPATSTDVNPMVTFANPGTYNVTLEVSNSAGGNTTTQMDYVVVNTVPTSSFTSSVNLAAVDFTNTATGATSYLWDFGNTVTSNEANPTYTYPEDGTYTVTLTSINACGETTTTDQITIVTPPTAGFTPSVTAGCAPMTIDFTNNSSDNATDFNWSFPGGSPATSTAANPSVTYANAGTYSVTLEVSNAAGDNTITQTDIIVINEAPMASIGASNNLGMVTFTNSSTNYTSVMWDFGNMDSSNEIAPTYTYTEEGTYTVTMSATNECGTTTATETINVVFPPSAGFSVANTVGCAPFEVTFNNESSDNAISFQWEFEGAFPASSTDFEPTVVYNMVGTYNVTLTVMNSAGEAVATETSYITVETTPDVTFTSDVNASDVTFTNNSSNAISYSWDFGDDNTSNETNPAHTYAEDGIYTVTLTATNNCGDVTTTQNVAIATAAPLALFSAEDGTTGCAPFEVTFANQSSDNADSFEWTFQGGTPATSTETNPTVVFATPGTYTVTLAATNIFGTNTYTETNYITVEDAPTAGFTSTIASPAVQFQNTSTGATSYVWTFGEGGMSNEENPIYEYDQNGTYTVTLVATNDCGSTTIIQEVEVLAIAPSPSFASDVREGCLPFTVTYEDLSTNDPTSWEWTFPGGTPATSTDQNPVVTYDAPGIYDATLSASNIAGSNSVTFTEYVTVNDVPVGDFDFTTDLGVVIFENNSLYGATFTWDFGDDSPGSSSADPTHTYTEDGEYNVVLVVENECGTDIYQETVTIVISGLADVPFIDELSLYPNPNNGAFSLTINGQANINEDLALSFYNVVGQKIYQETIQFNGSLNKFFLKISLRSVSSQVARW